MPSKRLEQIETAIQRLVDAKTAGSAAEVAAARALLDTPLSSDLTPPQILEAGKARLGQFEEAVQRQGNIVDWTKAANKGIAAAAANLERPDRLGIPAAEIDAEINQALGIAAQAVPQLSIHPGTGLIIEGRVVGELPLWQPIRVVEALSGASGPISRESLMTEIVGEKKARSPQGRGILTRFIGMLNQSAEKSGLPPVVENPDGKGFVLGPKYVVSGRERGFHPEAAEETPSGVRPVTYRIGQVLQMEGIAGFLSETQARNLIQGLVASGDLPVGVDVVEGKAQRRGKGREVVRDLELTPTGVSKLRLVVERFGGQGKIYVKSVVRALGEQGKPAPVAQTADDEGQRFWGAQVVADLKNVGTGTLNTLQQAGIFREGEHFEVIASGKRIYKPAARQVARKLDEAAAAAPIGRITREFVLKTFGQPEKVKPTDQAAWEKYGPNGPSVLTPFHELAALRSLQQCAPKIGERLGGEISPEFSDDLGKWIAARQTELLESTPEVQVSEEEKLRIRRETAATVLKMYQDLRPFNNIREELGGLEFLVDFVKAAKQEGERGKMIVEDFAEALVHPSVAVKNPNSPWNGGVVGGDITRIGRLA